MITDVTQWEPFAGLPITMPDWADARRQDEFVAILARDKTGVLHHVDFALPVDEQMAVAALNNLAMAVFESEHPGRFLDAMLGRAPLDVVLRYRELKVAA